ncbi:MAG TPA: SLBB domain-containing protein [Arachidicoccus sp.]
MQYFSPANIRNIDVASLSNDDIMRIKNEMNKQNLTIDAAESLAISNGMSAQNFAVLKARLSTLTPQAQENTTVPIDTTIKEEIIQLDKNAIAKPQIYGSEFFTSTSLSFEPNSSMATPASYVLGAGDELQLVIYGMQEYTSSFAVSNDGFISIPVVGQVFVSGLNFEAAKTKIKNVCQKVYPSLATGASQLSLSLSKIRTIHITIIGAQKPGNYSVSSLSTVFNALHIAGGPDGNGSYRNIELIRNGKVVKTIDIYRFLTTGNQADNVNLQENDVVRIPVYENRVKIEGNVKRPGIFELLPTETFDELLDYAGGFDEAAYRKNIKLVQNAENGIGTKVFDLTEAQYKSYKPKIGDVFKVSPMIANFENRISVKGSVYRPDNYEFKAGMTVKDLIDKAEGITQDAYMTRALLIREKDDLTKEITYVNLNDVLNGQGNTVLRKNDELIVSSLFNYNNNRTISINGQVKNPGEYPFIENIKLYDLILMAGGFTDGASRLVDVSSIIIRDEKAGQNSKVGDVKTLEMDTSLIDQTSNISLSPYDMITVRKKPVFETLRSVVVKGEVEYPGNYTITDKKERVSDLISRTGGLKYFANLDGMRVVRTSEVVKADGTKATQEVIIPINYKKLFRNLRATENFALQNGDVLIVPEKRNTVVIYGQVQVQSEIPYFSKNVRKYISSSGGFGENASKEGVYVIQANGLASATKTILGVRYYPKVQTGATIVVPYKNIPPKEKVPPYAYSIIASGVAGVTAATVAIISLLNK